MRELTLSFSTSYSGCLLYKNDDKLSTISIEFDELPINIASLHPWFIASTSVGLLIFAPDHETSLLQKIPVQSIHSMSTCHDLIFCGTFSYIFTLRFYRNLHPQFSTRITDPSSRSQSWQKNFSLITFTSFITSDWSSINYFISSSKSPTSIGIVPAEEFF